MITFEIEVAREMLRQGVSSFRLRGPIGDEVRRRARPTMEALIKLGLVHPDTLAPV